MLVIVPWLAAADAPVVLPNGLSVLAVECTTSDVCGVHIALKIGPERVPPEKAGLRALTQQVLLGCIRERMNEREDLSSLRQQGSQGAGFAVETQWDHVEFVATVTSGELARLLGFTGPAILEAEWTQDDIVNAREIIGQEQGGEFEGPAASYRAYYLFRKALAGRSSVVHPIFGTDETRQSITLADVKTFYKSYYVPNLTSVCVVGPLPAEEVVDLVKTSFGRYKARELASSPAADLGGEETRVETGLSPEANGAVVIIGVPLPPVGSDGYTMGQILHAALSGPEGSLATDKTLSTALPLAARIGARDAHAFAVMPIPISRSPYLAAFSRALPTKIEAVREGILGQILKFGHEPLSEEALRRAKMRAINLHALPMDQPGAAATLLNRHSLFGGEHTTGREFADRVNAVTAAELQEFAKRQFTRHAVGVLMPGS